MKIVNVGPTRGRCFYTDIPVLFAIASLAIENKHSRFATVDGTEDRTFVWEDGMFTTDGRMYVHGEG